MCAHQLVATIPVESTRHRRTNCRGRSVESVPNEVTFLAYIDDSQPTECSGVVRLSSTRGVKSSAIERHGTVTACRHRSFKRRKVCVAKIEQFGQ